MTERYEVLNQDDEPVIVIEGVWLSLTRPPGDADQRTYNLRHRIEVAELHVQRSTQAILTKVFQGDLLPTT